MNDSKLHKLIIMSDNPEKIVLIDPVTETVSKIYESIHDICDDLNIKSVRHIADCLYHRTNQFGGYILKFEKDATPENIKIYSGKSFTGLNGEKRCPICKKWFTELYPWYCNPCRLNQRKDYLSTKKGYFTNVLCRMKTNSKQKIKVGRIDAGICNVDYQFLIDLFEEQKGCCFYSGLKMTHIPTTNWQCSPERLDETKGYISGNIKLICLEFNTGHTQWNKNKVLQIKELVNKVLDFEQLKVSVATIKNKPKPPTYRRPETIIDDEILYHCIACNKYLKHESFGKVEKSRAKSGLSSYCVICMTNTKKEYRNSMKGFVTTRLNLAKGHAKKISKNKTRHAENSVFELTIDILIQKILTQKGRCDYSNIPFTYTSNSDWMMSIERLDSKKGYTEANCVLICNEFNSTDRTSIMEHSEGSSQWSKSKFEYFMKNMKI